MTLSSNIRPGLTMSKMGIKPKEKKEFKITDDAFTVRKLNVLRQHYDSLYSQRKQREKAVRYFNGDQWHEVVTDGYGNAMREDQYIISQGQIPFVQNIIEPNVRSLIGQFRTDTTNSVVVSRTPDKNKESEMLSNALQYVLKSINNIKELDARALEELLMSGLCIQKVGFERIPHLKKRDVVVRNIHPSSIFFNGDIQDIRGNDIRIIGELHDWTIDQVVQRFANSEEGVYSKKREEQLRELYSSIDRDHVSLYGLDPEQNYSKDFYIPIDVSKCRVIECWEERHVEIIKAWDYMSGKEIEFESGVTIRDIEALNDLRIASYNEYSMRTKGIPIDPEEVPIFGDITIEKGVRWYYSFYTPWGHLLREGETPYWHGSHPYIQLAYPLLDGKAKGLVTSLIAPQRQVNRLLILRDMILGSSVKNTLVVDKDSLDGQSEDDLAFKLKTPGSVLTLDMKKGQVEKPFELRGAPNNMGIPEMLQTYIKLMQDISGVNPAMQGQEAPSGTSGTLYAQQAQNSTLNSKDIMDSFSGLFRKQRDMKVLKTIQQFYTEKRMIAVSGKSYSETAQLYDPEAVQNIDFDLVIGQTSDSPVYRNMINERLSQFLQGGLIDLEMYLEQTTDPFASSMLESVRKRKEEAAIDPQGAMMGLNQDVNQLAQQQAVV